MWLTGIKPQVPLMNCSLFVRWSYIRVMLQLVGAAGTVIQYKNWYVTFNHMHYYFIFQTQFYVLYSKTKVSKWLFWSINELLSINNMLQSVELPE